MFAFAKRSRAYYYVLMSSIQIYAVNLLSLIYLEPRPYMIDALIIPDQCYLTFGGPCYESMVSGMIIMALFLDQFHSNNN